MAKCGECSNEKIMCVCPKGLGGGDDGEEDPAYDEKIEQVASAIINQCVDFQQNNPGKATELINQVQEILGDPIANQLMEQLANGVYPKAKEAKFKKDFKKLGPNKAMLEELSDKLNLGIFPNPANELSSGIKQAIDALGYMPPYPDNIGTHFEEVLQSYAVYSKNDKLTPAQKLILPVIFWTQIEKMGTPIIERFNEDKVNVHFLFPTSGYKSAEKKLYVAGDFHGFGSTRKTKQEMNALGSTGIMHRADTIPKDSVITYNFVQVDNKFADQSRPYFAGPSEAHPSNFYPSNLHSQEISAFKEPKTTKGLSPFKGCELPDNYSKHSTVACCPPGMSMLYANIDNELPELGLVNVEWPTLLNADSSKTHLHHKQSYLCNKEDNLSEDNEISPDYTNKIFSDQNHTRAINVFEPNSGEVEHVLVVNDGIGYLATNMVDRLDELMREGKIPENTAVIFVTTLPGLANKHSQNVGSERAIEYGSNVEEYSQFLSDKLLPELGYGDIPVENRTIMGSSMSGTASIYMGMPHTNSEGVDIPAQFGHVIAQAPSYSNREILDQVVDQRIQNGRLEDLSSRIKLSCGKFDSLDHAQNLNWDHTQALAKVLGSGTTPLPVKTGNYGHLIHCWSQEVTTTLPNFYQPALSQELLNINSASK